MFDRIDHVGIAVHSIEKSRGLYENVFGLELEREEVVESQGVRVACFQTGESLVELLEPIDEDSPISDFLEDNGEGIHHLALGCDDIDKAREIADEHGLRLLSDAPIEGAANKLITFAHPKDTGGVLFEFTQRKET
jgi:methylmalonyl-CoA/ethylmalonyl-CoA epimerase